MDRDEFINEFSKRNPQKTREVLFKICFSVINNYFGSLSTSLTNKDTDPDSYQLYQYHGGLFFKTSSLKMEFVLTKNSIEVRKNDKSYDIYLPREDEDSVYSKKYGSEITFDFLNSYLPLFMD